MLSLLAGTSPTINATVTQTFLENQIMYQAKRLGNAPIITQAMAPSLGDNINGPSLIRVPDWFTDPLGRYYLYFAHHHGKHVRMAYADKLAGPWTIYNPSKGVLTLEQTVCHSHIASPDVHLDHDNQRVVMYFHGPFSDFQHSFVAASCDGLTFNPQTTNLGPFYFRVFEHEDNYYALAKEKDNGTKLLRSSNRYNSFEPGPNILPNSRHTALLKHGDQLDIFFSCGGDCPEQIMVSRMALTGDWKTWQPGKASNVLKPEMNYEGANEPLSPSAFGAVNGPVNQLRDPAIFVENEKIYMVYSCAGETSLALAKLTRL